MLGSVALTVKPSSSYRCNMAATKYQTISVSARQCSTLNRSSPGPQTLLMPRKPPICSTLIGQCRSVSKNVMLRSRSEARRRPEETYCSVAILPSHNPKRLMRSYSVLQHHTCAGAWAYSQFHALRRNASTASPASRTQVVCRCPSKKLMMFTIPLLSSSVSRARNPSLTASPLTFCQ